MLKIIRQNSPQFNTTHDSPWLVGRQAGKRLLALGNTDNGVKPPAKRLNKMTNPSTTGFTTLSGYTDIGKGY